MQENSNIELLVTAVKPRTGNKISATKTFSLRDLKLFNRVTAQEKVAFLSELSMMLKARVPIVKALDVLAGQARNSRLKTAIGQLLSDVRKGISFSAALARQPDIFDSIVAVTAEVGQETGRLPEVLSSLAEHEEKVNALRKKVTQALAYPVLVLIVAAVVVLFLLLYIVPNFAHMFRVSNVPIPKATQIVIGASNFISAYWVYLFFILLLIALLSKWLMGSELKNAVTERYGLQFPWIGGIMIRNYTARFCRTLGTLLQSQVPLVDALGVTRKVFANRRVRGEIDRLIKHVKQGRTVAEPLSSSEFFPPAVAQMIAVGEETSELETMLLRVAAYYESELERLMETLTTIIEPVLIVFLGAIVGTILITMYLPMFDMASTIGGG